MNMEEGIQLPDDRMAIAPFEFARRLVPYIAARQAPMVKNKWVVRGYMLALGNPALGAAFANTFGLHNSQAVMPPAARAAAGQWSRVLQSDPATVRTEPVFDLALVAPPRGVDVGPWVKRAVDSLKRRGILLVAMPESEFRHQDPRAFTPLAPGARLAASPGPTRT